MRFPLCIGLYCLVAACSGGGSTKIVDARDPDGAPAVDGGAGNDSSSINLRDSAATGVDQPRQDSGFVATDAGAASELGTTLTDGPAKDDLAPVDVETERNNDLSIPANEAGPTRDLASQAVDANFTRDAAAPRATDASAVDASPDIQSLDTVDANDLASDVIDAPSIPDLPITPLLDSASSVDSAAPPQDLAMEAIVDAAPDTAVIPANTYYVSPSGNDATGDGTAAHPWKTITASALRIDYALGLPTLNLAAGTYDEKVVLHDSIIIHGAGSANVTIQNSNAGDTDYVITADGNAPTVAGVVVVTMTGLRVDGLASKNRGIHANQAAINLDDVNVYQPSGFGISIGTNITGFVIDNTTVGFEGMLYSDVGIDVGNGSSGTIRHFTGGDHIDHIINIGLGCTVDISDSQLTGSPIWYADGIRIQGASNVTIRNTTILRPAGSDPASAGPAHNPPYAAIEVAASSNGNALVTVDGCTMHGFDVGIGVNLMFNRLVAQNNSITGNLSAEVRTVWAGSMAQQYPLVDLGGGSLGSVGNNDFGPGAEYAIDLGGPYDVSAKDNLWSGTDIETRIHDQLDNAQLGRVLY